MIKYHKKKFLFITYYTKLWLAQKALRIRFDKVQRFAKAYDGDRYLVSFGPEKYDVTYN